MILTYYPKSSPNHPLDTTSSRLAQRQLVGWLMVSFVYFHIWIRHQLSKCMNIGLVWERSWCPYLIIRITRSISKNISCIQKYICQWYITEIYLQWFVLCDQHYRSSITILCGLSLSIISLNVPLCILLHSSPIHRSSFNRFWQKKRFKYDW